MTDLHESFLEQKKKDEDQLREYGERYMGNAGAALGNIVVKIWEDAIRETLTKPVNEAERMVFESDSRELIKMSGDY